MKKKLLCAGFLSALVLSLMPNNAQAQTAKDLVGSWEIVSLDSEAKDGAKVPGYGEHPQGMVMFGPDGRFIIYIGRRDLPKFASNSMMHGTPEEYKAIGQGSVADYGTYKMEGNVLIDHVEGGSFPNWNGTDQRRTVVRYTGDEMTWKLDAPNGIVGLTNVRRLK